MGYHATEGNTGSPDEHPLVDPVTKETRKDSLEFIVRSLLKPNRRLQEMIVNKYISDDVEFVHILGSAKGKKKFYYVYRGAATFLNYAELGFENILIDDKAREAVVWVNARIGLPFFPYLSSSWFPIIAFLKIKEVSGQFRICRQLDHHSMFVIVTAFGRAFFKLFDKIINPISGMLLVGQGRLIDAVSRAWEHFLHPDNEVPSQPSFLRGREEGEEAAHHADLSQAVTSHNF